jgi:N-acetylglutamate synthase-like GNAT family acetyltransferase
LLVQAAEERARERSIHAIFALTTRAVTFFENLGYRISDSSVMPEDRARKCEESERSSAVLTKELA